MTSTVCRPMCHMKNSRMPRNAGLRSGRASLRQCKRHSTAKVAVAVAQAAVEGAAAPKPGLVSIVVRLGISRENAPTRPSQVHVRATTAAGPIISSPTAQSLRRRAAAAATVVVTAVAVVVGAAAAAAAAGVVAAADAAGAVAPAAKASSQARTGNAVASQTALHAKASHGKAR